MANAVDFLEARSSKIDVFVAVDVGAEGDVLAVWREFAAADFPFIFREPRDLLACDVEQANVVVAVASVRGKQHAPAVGRDVVARIALFAAVRREQRAFSGCDVGDEDIRIRALGLLLRVDDVFAVFRPDGIVIALILRRAAW